MKDRKSEMPQGSAEALRQKAINNVLALKRENAPRISDRSWTSHTGYNYGRWADRGFNIALGFLGDTVPQEGESCPDYLRRVVARVRAQRDEYQADETDVDGACSGALGAAMWAIIDAIPKEPPPQEPLSDPAPEAEWAVWYEDTFDRECPRSVEVSGRGLVNGLMELWARHLFGTVRPGGGRGFSRFNLWWDPRSVAIKGNWKGATRLREWVFGAKVHSRQGYVKEGDARLLEMIAVAHAHLLLANQSSESILEMAATSADRLDFEEWISNPTKR